MILASVILLFISLFLIYKLYHLGILIQELKTKTDLSVSDKNPLAIEFSGNGPVKNIADNFNLTIRSNQTLKKELDELDNLKSEKLTLDNHISHVKQTLNQLRLINDLGKEISSKLTRKEIVSEVAKILFSSVRISELHFVIRIHPDKEIHYILDNQEHVELSENGWLYKPQNIVKWSADNQKEILLNEAIADFARYVFIPVVMYNGKAAKSVAGVPFSYQDKMSGCIVVFSDIAHEFDQYIIELMNSLLTFFTIAIENAQLYEAIDEEKDKSDRLLLNILPFQIAEELKTTGTNKPKYFGNVTVMFTDFIDFTRKAEILKPEELVADLDYCFTKFDDIIQKNGVEKIKTIGDAYMCAAGLPDECSDHAERIIRSAIEISQFLDSFSKSRKSSGKNYFEARIGINTGPVIAGVVGKSKFAYDIWGDTVNVAARMEQNSESGKINISGATYEMVKNNFSCTHRGKIQVKNKGEIDMYFVEMK